MKTLAYILILITLFYMLPSPTEASISATAIKDARYDAQQDIDTAIWFFAGCCLSGAGFTIAYLKTPDIPVRRFMGKPPEYVFFYIEEYERKTKKLQTYYTFWGSLTGFSALVIFYLMRSAR